LLAATEISTALYNLVSKFEHLPVPAANMLAVMMDEYEKAGNVTIEIIRCVHMCFSLFYWCEFSATVYLKENWPSFSLPFFAIYF
jgi:hypothetical protein